MRGPKQVPDFDGFLKFSALENVPKCQKFLAPSARFPTIFAAKPVYFSLVTIKIGETVLRRRLENFGCSDEWINLPK